MEQVAGMSEAISGLFRARCPACRYAHAGYGLLTRINIRQRHRQSWWIKLDRALRHDAGENRVPAPARMMNHQRLVRIDDEIMGHTRHAEIAGELVGGIDAAR
jgi:hypothetical protein